jgi:hypothetical protein
MGSTGLPAVLTVKAGLTATSGRRWIYTAQARDTSLTAERLGQIRRFAAGLDPEPARGADRGRWSRR